MSKNIVGVPPAQTSSVSQGQQSAQQQTSQQQGQSQGGVSQGSGGQPQGYYFYPYQAVQTQYYPPPAFNSYNLNQYGNRFAPQQQPLFPPPAQSASPANAKVPTGVQQPSAAYSQGLYSQQSHGSSSYDDGYSHHGQLPHQHGQGVAALGSADYNKSLYGGGQGIQSFMSMGQNSAPSANAPLSQRPGGGSSPENTYKQYGGPGVGVGGKDVASQGGVGIGAQGGLGQGARSGIQQPPLSQGFYGANRFSSNSSATGGLGQQQQQQQPNQGYQQGNGGDFYYQRQQYWQQQQQ